LALYLVQLQRRQAACIGTVSLSRSLTRACPVSILAPCLRSKRAVC
jgi:hypothetical protein